MADQVQLNSMCTIQGVPVSCRKVDETTFFIGSAPPPLRSRLDFAGKQYRIMSMEEVIGQAETIWELNVELIGR